MFINIDFHETLTLLVIFDTHIYFEKLYTSNLKFILMWYYNKYQFSQFHILTIDIYIDTTDPICTDNFFEKMNPPFLAFSLNLNFLTQEGIGDL